MATPAKTENSVNEASVPAEKKENTVSKSGPRKFSLQIGGGATAFMGVSENVLFNSANTGYIATVYLGYRFGRLRHSAGLFGTMGNLSGSTTRFLSRSYRMTIAASIDTEVQGNKYVDFEAGVLLWEKLRLSAGPSWMWVSLSDGATSTINLGTSTLGFQLRTGPLRWFVNGTAYFNKEFDRFFIRPSAGLVIQLYMIRFY